MNQSTRIRFADFEADIKTGELRKHGFRVRLQEKPFQVLAAILERPGELISRDELRNRLWSADTFVDFDNNLNTAVYKLREALGDTAETPRFIETLPKKGYRFIGALASEPAAEATAARPHVQVSARAWRVPLAASLLVALVGAAGYFALTTKPSTALASSRNPQARESFFKGQYFLQKGGPENARAAIPHLQEAVQTDEEFAEAYAALADALVGAPGGRKEKVERARAAAERAVALNPSLAAAHHRLASIYLYDDWNWNAARQAFERALALEPDSAPLHHSYAGYFSLMGEHERAYGEMKRAIELNPVSVAINADAGWYWFVARRYDDAVAQSKKALELEPQHRAAHYYIVLALSASGNLAEARRWAGKYVALLGGTPEERARVASGTPTVGLENFWRIRLTRALERSKSEPVPAAEIALGYAAVGDAENALAYLEKSYEEHSGWLLPFMGVYPPLDALRTHPRFLALQQRMNFPPKS